VNDLAPSVHLLKPDLPPWVDEIVARALSKDPAHRFQSADEFRKILADSLAGPVKASGQANDATVQMAIPDGGKSSGHKSLWLRVAVAIITISVIGVPWLWRSRLTPGAFLSGPLTPLAASPLPIPPYAAQLPAARKTRNVGAEAEIERRNTEIGAGRGLAEASADRGGSAGGSSDLPGSDKAGMNPPATQAAFGDVKLLVVEEVRTISRDIVLNLSNSEMTLLPNDGGAPITAIPYRDVARATYVHARDPRWEPLLSGPATKVNVPGIFGRARHWLVVQTKNRYAILQLDADHWLNILQMFELRAGLRIGRPTAGEAATSARIAK
jgi:hypothetical protein